MNIIEAFKQKEDLCFLQGATKEMIAAAESDLDLSFSEEYKEYLRNFGIATANGHEFTGIINSPRLNVVDVTQEERMKNYNIPNDLYVIENLNIDKVIAWQNAAGEVFQTISDSVPEKISESLAEYLDS